ncbi:MAG: sigma-54 dependent transcriptional regulator [Bacteroidota bacterium]
MDHDAIEIVATSQSILNILEQLRTVALSDSTVLLIGETGVGKERFAEYLHHKSVRRFKPLVKVGVSTLPRELVESELFGHEKGSFTGAAVEKKGLFEVANGGSLYFDDIDDLPIEIQPKLLRAMEAHEIQHVGGTRPIRIDVRFIAASKVSLKDLVDQGRFRADLFYRLNVVPITIPPLRDRREDIPPLIEQYVRHFLPDKRVTVSKEALKAFVNYSWPGNVRELVNVLVRVLLFVNDHVDLEDLPREIRGEDPISMLIKSCSRCFFEERMNYDQILACLETNLLRQALEMHHGNRSRAADFLGLKLSTFRDKLVKYNLDGIPIAD